MVNTIESSIEYIFKDKKFLDVIENHPGIVTEYNHRYLFQRLEFLGDRILGMVIGEYLYCHSNHYNIAPIYNQIVNRTSLSNCFDILNLQVFVNSKSFNEKIKSDIIEVIIGAIYIDGGLYLAKTFILNHIIKNKTDCNSSKSKLQEITQKYNNSIPVYETKALKDGGFMVTVIIKIAKIYKISAYGKSKKDGEIKAAHKCLEEILTLKEPLNNKIL